MAKVLILLCVVMLAVTASSQLLNLQPRYVHMAEPCPPEEKCFLNPDAVCKFDCLVVDEQGQGSDCIYNFYDASGKRVPCWLF